MVQEVVIESLKVLAGHNLTFDVVAVFPSLDALTCADPGASAITSPCGDTSATEGFVLDQVSARSARARPRASRGAAESCVASLGWSVSDTGLRVIVQTGSVERIGISLAVHAPKSTTPAQSAQCWPRTHLIKVRHAKGPHAGLSRSPA